MITYYFNNLERWPLNENEISSFEKVLGISTEDIGYFPFLCFDYIERFDNNVFQFLVSYLELFCYDSYVNTFEFLGYKNIFKGRTYKIERLFQKVDGQDMWNKWIHERSFTIFGKDYYINGNTITEYNFQTFAFILYLHSNKKYLPILKDCDGKKICYLCIKNIHEVKNINYHVDQINEETNIHKFYNKTLPNMNVNTANIDVFISYSRKDSTFVHSFLDLFKKNGINVWIDIDGIESGDAFKQTITRAIKSSRIFLFFSSKYSNSSDYTAKEINLAVHFKKIIIPILIDNSEYNDEVIFDLAGLDYLDYSNGLDKNILNNKLIKSILNILNRNYE